MDWKEALSQMAGVENTTEQKQQEAPVEKNKRKGVVYSTNPDYTFTVEVEEEEETLPKNQQPLHVSMERSGRGGKTVTLVRGFIGTTADLEALGKWLKLHLGVGGSVKDGEIIIQGDHRQRLSDILRKEGYTQTRG